jgi:hypothetical protein
VGERQVHVVESAAGVRYVLLPSSRRAFREAMTGLGATALAVRAGRPAYRVPAGAWPQTLRLMTRMYPQWRLFHPAGPKTPDLPPWVIEAMVQSAADEPDEEKD